jgi:glycosyltransferase involved in cell wall biosynthesis
MNILHITATMNPSAGGVCQGIRNLIPELSILGVSNEIVSLDDENSDFLKSEDLVIQAMGSGKGIWHWNRKLKDWLSKNFYRYDLVILHGLWSYPSYATWKAIRKYRRSNGNFPKIYVMPHGMLEPYFQNAPNRKFKSLRNSIYWHMIEKKVVNEADGLLFTCQQELIMARTTFNDYVPKKELYVGLGIKAPPDYNPLMFNKFLEKCPQVKDQKYFLFLSRIHEIKGIVNLLNAYIEVLKKGFSDIGNLVIAGPGIETAYGRKIFQQVNQDPLLKTNVFFPGMLRGDAKWGAFYHCDSFILPSYQESFGVAIVEAMACSKPVLITDEVNIWPEIKDASAGFVEEASLEGTEKLLIQWLNLDTETKKFMGENAKACYLKNFSVENTAKRLYNAIN